MLIVLVVKMKIAVFAVVSLKNDYSEDYWMLLVRQCKNLTIHIA